MDVADWAVNHRLPQVYWISHFCSKSLNDKVYLNAWKAHTQCYPEPLELKTDLCTNSVNQRTIDNQSLSLHYFNYSSSQIWSCFEAQLWYLIDDLCWFFWACINLSCVSMCVCICVDTKIQKNTSVFSHLKKHITSKACFWIIFHLKIKRIYIYIK